MDDDIVQFGCIRCKRTKRTEEVDQMAEAVMLEVFEAAFSLIHAEGQRNGVEVSDNLRAKLFKWGVKQSILPPDAK